MVLHVLASLALWMASASSATPPAQAAGEALAAHHADGSFEVTMTPESATRYAMEKTFTGGLAGTSRGTLIGADEATAYVALETFEGTLDGRQGGFVLLHRGFVSKADGMSLDVVIAPDSGTGALAGIRGKLAIHIAGGAHTYDLAYTLPVQ